MLEAGSYMFALHPTHIGGGQLAGEQGVLRQIFKIASAQRHPFMVHGGAQQNVYASALASRATAAAACSTSFSFQLAPIAEPQGRHVAG